MKKLFFLSLCAITTSLVAMPNKDLLKTTFNKAILSIPSTSKAPILDGVIGKDWQNFTSVNGFSTDKKILISGCEGFVRFNKDKNFLYIGVATSTPSTAPGGALQTNTHQRDGKVYEDDCVEVYFRVKDTTYVLILNAAQCIFDMKRVGNIKDAKWNFKKLKTASLVENGWWNLELAIPLAELGSPKEMKLNVIRRWSKAGAGSLNYTPAALNDKFMFTTQLVENAPEVKEISYGDVLTGSWDFQAQVVNPLNTSLDFEVLLYHHGKTIVTESNDKCTILPQQTKKVNFTSKVQGNKIRLLILLLKDKNTGKIYYSRRVMIQRGAALGRRPVTSTIVLENAGSGQLYLLPGYQKAVIEFRVSTGKAIKNVTAAIGTGKSVSFTFKQNLWKGVLPIPKKAGKYPLKMTLHAANGKKMDFKNVYEVKIRHFEWENNSIGKDKIILPPFTALKVEKNTITNLTTKRKINGLGLYDSVIADGKELLASPITATLVANGKNQPINSKLLEVTKDKTGYSTTIKTLGKTPLGITLSTKGYLEYDGFHWVTLELDSSKKVKIDKFTLRIPLKSSEVPLFHAVANELRTNPAGALPKGNGILWKGSKLPRKKHAGEEVLHPQMVPYLWLGAEKSGLSFFMDSTFGCKLDRTKDAVRIIRNGQTVWVEIDFINLPTTLTKKRTIEFGFHPTPVKPVGKEQKNIFYDCEGKFLPGAVKAQFFMPDVSMNFPSRWSKYPLNKNYTFVNEFTNILKSGKKFDIASYTQKLAVHKKQIEKKLLPFAGGKERYLRLQKLIQGFLKLYTSSKYRGKTLPFCYFDHRLEFLGDAETDYFKSEWFNPASQSYFAALRTTHTKSNLDYLVYYLDKMVAAGLHGINLDDSYLMPENNPDTLAKIDDEGELHSTVGILAQRELLNRLAVVLHKHKRYPMVLNVHMTDALLVPCFAKVTLQTGFEMNYGENPHQERFSPDYIRAVGLGTKIGANSLLLRGFKRKNTPLAQWKAKENILMRHLWGVMLPFGVRHANSQNDAMFFFTRKLVNAGIVSPESEFLPCWEQKLVTAPSMLISCYKMPNKSLVIISNYFNEQPKTVSLSINFKGLGLSENAEAWDLETNQKVDVKQLNVKGYDFRLILLKDKK
jgi:hypothetical protein